MTALATYLSSNFGPRVTALNTEYGDAVVLTTPAKYAIAEVLEVDAYPLVQVLCDDTQVKEIIGGLNESHQIRVICTVMDDSDVGEEKANLRKRVYRYARAIVELIRSAQAPGGIAPYSVHLSNDLITFGLYSPHRGSATTIGACGVKLQMQIQEAG